MAALGTRHLAVFGAIAVLATGVAVHPSPIVQRVDAVVARVTGRGKTVNATVAMSPGRNVEAPAAAKPAAKDPGAASGFNPALPGCTAAPASAARPAPAPGAPPDFLSMGSCGEATSKAPAQPPTQGAKKPDGR